MTWNEGIMGMATLLYLAAFLANVVNIQRGEDVLPRMAWPLLFAAFGLHSAGLAARWAESYSLGAGHAPLSNFYESLVIYAWCIALVLILMKGRLHRPAITMLAILAAFLLMAYASFFPGVDRHIRPLVPALQSNWLHVHVLTCFIAYACFAISFLCGLIAVLRPASMGPVRLEDLNYQCVIVGFSMLTAGILTGRYGRTTHGGRTGAGTQGDMVAGHMDRLRPLPARAPHAGWTGRRIAFLSIVGFMSVIFTYLGVNFILAGLHSYGAY
jgi:ABC-type transport system involved in cytochrome c biogenesis permease subunit